MYSTRIKKCVCPHYKGNDGSQLAEVMKNVYINVVFEGQVSIYEKYGHRMSTAICGMCLADLFAQYGLTQKDDNVKTLFSNMSCFSGKDSGVSLLVASMPYIMRNNNLDNQKCPSNVLYPPGTLVLPRGEFAWQLLSIPGDRICTSLDPHTFRIYITRVKDRDRIEPIKNVGGELKSHREHLGITKVETIPLDDDVTKRHDAYYVTLNPFIYTRIKAYRCVPPEGRNLEDQFFMLHKMNLLYSQTMGAMAVIPVEAKRLLQYPPGTRETTCCPPDLLNVGIPESVSTDIDAWAIKEEKEQHKNHVDGFNITGSLPKNMIFFPDAKDFDTCKSNIDNFHNFIQEYESSYISQIREEYAEIKVDRDFYDYFDDNQRAFWYKFIKHTYPSKLSFKGEVISSFTPNCQLTPLGVVAIRNICQNDYLVFKDNEMKIDEIHLPNKISPWECVIEKVDIPEYRKIPDSEKAGETINKQRVQANPLTFTPAFVTSLGTNITILPTNP